MIERILESDIIFKFPVLMHEMHIDHRIMHEKQTDPKTFSVLHRGADCMFWSFGINELIFGYSEYTVPLKDLLGC